MKIAMPAAVPFVDTVAQLTMCADERMVVVTMGGADGSSGYLLV